MGQEAAKNRTKIHGTFSQSIDPAATESYDYTQVGQHYHSTTGLFAQRPQLACAIFASTRRLMYM
jgi:hypothetical protein